VPTIFSFFWGGRTAFVLPPVFKWPHETIKFVVAAGMAEGERLARLAGRYARTLHIVPSNSWIIRRFQRYSDISRKNAQDLGSFAFFRVLSHVLVFFSKNNRNTPGNPFKSNASPKMPGKTIDRSGNSDFSFFHHRSSVDAHSRTRKRLPDGGAD